MSKQEEALQVFAALQGLDFDVQGFDKFLSTIEAYPAHSALSQRRQAALEAMLANDEAAVLRHLEVLQAKWIEIARFLRQRDKQQAKMTKASEKAVKERRKTAAQQQETADKWFSLAWARNPHAGRDLLLTKAKLLIDADMASADKDMSRYAQAQNEAAEKRALSHKSKLRNEKDLLTRTRAVNFLKAQKNK